MPQLELKVWLNRHKIFDEASYRSVFPDIHEMEPLDHYLEFGRFLGVAPSPQFDPLFYRETYMSKCSDMTEIDHYFRNFDRRPVRADQIDCAFAYKFRDMGVRYKRDFEKKISYCIPIKNRLGDIQATLQTNLETNRKFEADIEFIIGIFDEDDEAETWVNENFKDDLASGYLRIFRSGILDVWHFPRAKNAFRQHLNGAVHSSLDGDNFVTAEETQLTIDLWEKHGDAFVLHCFSGDHGDGSCGRVTTSANVYQAVGYDETLLTFQYDDISCILRTLHTFPWIRFFTFAGERNIFTEKQNRVLGTHSGLCNPIEHLERPNWKAPANPKGLSNVASDQKYRVRNHINSLITWQRLIPDELFGDYCDHFMSENIDWLVAISPRKELFAESFHTHHPYFADSEPSDEFTAILSVRDQNDLLKRQIDHLRSVGVERFLIVDDHSQVPLDQIDLGPDVHCFVPRSGHFRVTKKLWIETLAKVFVTPGSWLLVTDVDEFVEVPNGYDTLAQYLRSLPKAQQFVPGVLIDVVLGPNFDPETADPTDERTLDLHYCENSAVPTEAYREYFATQWAFKGLERVSWTVDIRHHMVGTYDCLRKVPLFRYDHKTHIHDGFHTLYNEMSDEVLKKDWLSNEFVVIRHEKLIQYKMDLDPNIKDVEAAHNAEHSRNRRILQDAFAQDAATQSWLKPYSPRAAQSTVENVLNARS